MLGRRSVVRRLRKERQRQMDMEGEGQGVQQERREYGEYMRPEVRVTGSPIVLSQEARNADIRAHALSS